MSARLTPLSLSAPGGRLSFACGAFAVEPEPLAVAPPAYGWADSAFSPASTTSTTVSM